MSKQSKKEQETRVCLQRSVAETAAAVGQARFPDDGNYYLLATNEAMDACADLCEVTCDRLGYAPRVGADGLGDMGAINAREKFKAEVFGHFDRIVFGGATVVRDGVRRTRRDIDASMDRQGLPRLTDQQWAVLRGDSARRQRQALAAREVS